MISSPPNRSTIANKHSTTLLRPDGLIQITWASGFTIGAAEAKVALADGNEVTGGEPHGLLVDMRISGPMDREARSVFVAASGWVFAVALWVGNPLSMVLANFFLGVSRVPRPTRMFTRESEAVAWLTTQRP